MHFAVRIEVSLNKADILLRCLNLYDFILQWLLNFAKELLGDNFVDQVEENFRFLEFEIGMLLICVTKEERDILPERTLDPGIGGVS